MLKRPGRSERRLFEALLADATHDARPLAQLIAAAKAADPAPDLARERAALAEYQRNRGRTPMPAASRRRVGPRTGTKLMVAVASALTAVTGVAAAAAAGALPAPIQRPAHEIFHAPPPDSPSDSPTPQETRPGPAQPASTAAGAPTTTPTTSAILTKAPDQPSSPRSSTLTSPAAGATTAPTAPPGQKPTNAGKTKPEKSQPNKPTKLPPGPSKTPKRPS
jgi:hypothetical protein